MDDFQYALPLFDYDLNRTPSFNMIVYLLEHLLSNVGLQRWV